MKDRELYYIYIGGGFVLLLIVGLYLYSAINTATRQLPLVIASYLDLFADEASLSLTSVLTLGTMSGLITLFVLTIRISSFVLLKFLFTNYGSLTALKPTAPEVETAYRQGYA